MKERGFTLVQPILVPRTGGHEETIRAVAIASRLAHLASPADPRWEQWLRDAPAKSVRRVKAPSHLDQALNWARSQGVPYSFHDGVLALVPMAYSEMPGRVRGSQVHGIDYPPSGNPRPTAPVTVSLLAGLSTGKAAAQAAHGVWAWARAHPHWNPLTGIEVRFTDAAGLIAAADCGGVTIRDGGLTEVDPGTVTAVVSPAPPRS